MTRSRYLCDGANATALLHGSLLFTKTAKFAPLCVYAEFRSIGLDLKRRHVIALPRTAQY